MHNSKSIWLPLALPLLLVGCGDKNEAVERPTATTETTQTTKTVVETKETETATEPAAEASEMMEEFDLEIKEDQVDQVKAINDTIEVNQLPVSATPEAASEVIAESDTSAEFVSGNYRYDITYATPKGNTDMSVTFALENNVITDVNLEGNPQHQTSVQYQTLLQDELGNLIIGKDRNEVERLESKVAGSSLTPTGFNEALAQLQAEA